MSSKNFYRSANYTMQKLFNFYRQNWVYIWLFLIISIIGIIMGISSVIKYIDSISKSNMTDTRFLDYLSGKISTFSLCMGYFARYFFVVTIFIFLCSEKFLSLMCYIIVLYMGYIAGINSAVISVVFGFSGIIHVILCYIPFFIMEVLLLSVVFCTLVMRQKCSIKLCNKSYFSFDKRFVKQMAFLIILGLVLFLVQAIINFFTTSTIIIVI